MKLGVLVTCPLPSLHFSFSLPFSPRIPGTPPLALIQHCKLSRGWSIENIFLNLIQENVIYKSTILYCMVSISILIMFSSA